ncbi:MAG: hypothetical protein ACE5J9_10500 [Methanosarcinales archaeon]
MRIKIPITPRSEVKVPLNLIYYASAIPMIFVMFLLQNIQTMGMVLAFQGFTALGEFQGSTAVSGLMYYLSPIHSPHDWIPSFATARFGSLGVPPPETWQIFLRVAIDATMFIIGGMIFALLWIKTTGIDAESLAQNIKSEIHKKPSRLRGKKRFKPMRAEFRRVRKLSVESIERVIQHYIPKLTIIVGAFIGFLTFIASLMGTLELRYGIGIIFAVSIVCRLYEDLASEQLMKRHPMMRKFIGAL